MDGCICLSHLFSCTLSVLVSACVSNQLFVTILVTGRNNQTMPLLHTEEPFRFVRSVEFSIHFIIFLLHLPVSNIATCLISLALFTALITSNILLHHIKGTTFLTNGTCNLTVMQRQESSTKCSWRHQHHCHFFALYN